MIQIKFERSLRWYNIFNFYWKKLKYYYMTLYAIVSISASINSLIQDFIM